MALTVAQMRALMNDTSRPKVFDLPTSGQIAASDINEELGRSPTADFSINGAEERALAEVPSGEIKFSDFYGKSAGSHNWGIAPSPATSYGYSLTEGYGSLSPITADTPAGASDVLYLNVNDAAPGNVFFRTDNSVDVSTYDVRLTYNGGVTTVLTFNGLDWNNNDAAFISYTIANNGNTVPLTIEFI